MKRSEINQALKEMEAMIREYRISAAAILQSDTAGVAGHEP